MTTPPLKSLNSKSKDNNIQSEEKQEFIYFAVREVFDKLNSGILVPFGIQSVEKPITIKELCELFGVTEATIIHLRKKGKITFIQVGNGVLFQKSAVLKSLENKKGSVKLISLSDAVDKSIQVKYHYLRNQRRSESISDNPYPVFRLAKIAITEFTLFTKINQFGPVTIVQLLPLFNEDARLIARCLNNIENRRWVKVIYTANGCKHYVSFNWKGAGV